MAIFSAGPLDIQMTIRSGRVGVTTLTPLTMSPIIHLEIASLAVGVNHDIEAEFSIANGYLVFANGITSFSWPVSGIQPCPSWTGAYSSHIGLKHVASGLFGVVSETIMCDRTRYRQHGLPGWSNWISHGSSGSLFVNVS
jgi:hypothetical protein